MAFSVRNLSVHAYSNGNTVWGYRARDHPLTDIDAPGYFNDAADMLSAGDVIFVHLPDGAAMRAVCSVGPSGVVIGPML